MAERLAIWLVRGWTAEVGNGDPRKLSAYAVLAEKSRRVLGKPLPFRLIPSPP
jgi:hypothetical protein